MSNISQQKRILRCYSENRLVKIEKLLADLEDTQKRIVATVTILAAVDRGDMIYNGGDALPSLDDFFGLGVDND